jgi:16S rRNA (uracil1498-N3)-methyltransferase
MPLNFQLIEEPFMPRFYCPQPLAEGALVDLPEAVAHHVRVVRLQPGAQLTLFNGDGSEYAAHLQKVGKKQATALVGGPSRPQRELPYAVTLVQALPEAAKMDWIIEKAVELGVHTIVPVQAQRSVVRLTGERADKRQAHWRGVIVAAAEQSGRNILAVLHPLSSLQNALSAGPSAVLLLSPRATVSLTGWAEERAAQDVRLLVGPEGGFTADEEQQAIAAGAQLVSMGPRVLRTETAALAALAALSALWGGMRA